MYVYLIETVKYGDIRVKYCNDVLLLAKPRLGKRMNVNSNIIKD